MKFLGNKTIISLDVIDNSCEEQEDEEEEFQDDKHFERNLRAPTISNPEIMACQPDIEELQFMSDQQLSHLKDFSIETRFGKV